MKKLSWDDLRLFVHVARGGGLSAAAAATGLSAATIGRRMLTLERSLARTLFVRRQTGYELTPEGRTLLSKALAMEASARPIADWAEQDGKHAVVRVSAGTWTAHFFATSFARLWTPDDPFRIAFKTTEARLDIGHREVEIGIRNMPSEGVNLASRKTGEVTYAPYRARGQPARQRGDWVAVAPEDAVTHSSRWVNAQEGLPIVAWANSPRTLHDLIRSGIGIGVLPCFAGDRDPALERAGPPVEALREGQWIVMHDDDRHRPEVRTVIDRIVALIESHAPLFRGERPIG